ncbi:Imm1 family immunity protein [Saccharothrix violaceirubra]|uniref:Uncharacterized protein n=1 Tax=Saccharothrix violaceirubra TaxID=413306 RepID=A0A7W7T7R3_9PSEU|nr:Imm1 family immunity protein [Saccharothrix violaceirubra]MBB4968139.1 hypothetical protein [Saccharothrix violaceirubra]
MGSLDVHYLYEHGDTPGTVSTVDEVDALIDRVRAESPPAAPILMEVHRSGDPYAQGLDVGIEVDRGASHLCAMAGCPVGKGCVR